MNNNKIRSYLVSGTFLLFVGLRDLDNFYLFYEGIALTLGIAALIMAGIEYKKRTDQENEG